jgi:hypothetical protein
MQYIHSLAAAIKGKAPIVALPVEGHAPICVARARLAKWSKGVTITSVKVTGGETYFTEEFIKPKFDWYTGPIQRPDWFGKTPEGPLNRIQHAHLTPRCLEITGTAGRVKTRCSFIPIDRRTAVKTLAAWSEKERARLEKKVLLGALGTKEKRALKLAKHESEGEGMISASIAYPNGKRAQVMGHAVSIPQLAELTFVVHRAVNSEGDYVDDRWTVSECVTGLAAGFGPTAEDAIVQARQNSAKASPDKLQGIRNLVASSLTAVAA